MSETMTKAKLLSELREARHEWDELLLQIPPERLTRPGAAGEWSVKDMIAHLTAYSKYFVGAAEAQLRGEMPPPDGTEGMESDVRNQHYYQLNKDRSLEEIQAESIQIFERLLKAVDQLPEEFLIQPQQFEGAPGPVEVWKILEGDVYGHYREHAQMVREWLERTA